MRKLLLMLLALPVVMSGCSSEPNEPNEYEQLYTYALMDLDENDATEIDVLVFRVDPNTGQEKYLYRINGEKISLANADISGNKKTYDIKVKYSSGTQKDRLVFLLNLTDEIDAVLRPTDVNTTLKDDLLQRLVFDTNGKWDANPQSSTYRSIPMWGESWEAHNFTDESPSTIVGKIFMMRALARIDIGLNYNANKEAQGLNNFVISEVRILNSNNKAIGVPKQGSYSSDLTTGITITATTIPAGTVSNQQLIYTVAPSEHSIDRSIYISEMTPTITPQPQPSDLHNQFHILIGGYFSTPDEITAGTPNTTKITWYRKDIHTIGQEPQTSRINIVRGYLYRLDIREVTGPGEQDPNDATEYLKSMQMISTIKAFITGGTDGEVLVEL